jgi:cytochrome c
MNRILSLATAFAIGLTANAGSAWAQSFAPHFDVQQAMQIAGRKVYADHCAVCHAQKAGARALGPDLSGVVNRAAASVAGFPYSDALKKSGLTWTEGNLQKWIADPSHVVPNTLMPHASLGDPAERIYVIEYLKLLKPSATR